MAYRTEQAYVGWVKRFILFHHKRHPSEMGASEVRAFLTHLARNRNVAASTQNQALNAIVFMYREVLHRDPGEFGEFKKAKRPKRLPTVLTRDEVQRVLAHLDGTYGLMARLLYGTGMRLMECVRQPRLANVADKPPRLSVTCGAGIPRSSPGRRATRTVLRSQPCVETFSVRLVPTPWVSNKADRADRRGAPT